MINNVQPYCRKLFHAEQSVKIQPVKLKVSAGQANYIRGPKKIKRMWNKYKNDQK